jgi:hypothetical protein
MIERYGAVVINNTLGNDVWRNDALRNDDWIADKPTF